MFLSSGHSCVRCKIQKCTPRNYSIHSESSIEKREKKAEKKYKYQTYKSLYVATKMATWRACT